MADAARHGRNDAAAWLAARRRADAALAVSAALGARLDALLASPADGRAVGALAVAFRENRAELAAVRDELGRLAFDESVASLERPRDPGRVPRPRHSASTARPLWPRAVRALIPAGGLAWLARPVVRHVIPVALAALAGGTAVVAAQQAGIVAPGAHVQAAASAPGAAFPPGGAVPITASVAAGGGPRHPRTDAVRAGKLTAAVLPPPPPSVSPAPSPAAGAAPSPVLIVSPLTLDLSGALTSGFIALSAHGGSIAWTASTASPDISLSAASGTLSEGAADSAYIEVTLTPAAGTDGNTTAVVDVNGTDVTVLLPQAAPGVTASPSPDPSSS